MVRWGGVGAAILSLRLLLLQEGKGVAFAPLELKGVVGRGGTGEGMS